MRVRQIREFNIALLGKWCWRMFGECVTRKVGDETDSVFWSYPWVGEIHLCERFRRLFDLAATKSRTVAEMFASEWEAEGEA
jgi:hypothetical protein